MTLEQKDPNPDYAPPTEQELRRLNWDDRKLTPQHAIETHPGQEESSMRI